MSTDTTHDEYLHYLHEADLVCTGYNVHFDSDAALYDAALNEVKAVQAAITPYLGFTPIFDDHIQDAAHFAEIHLMPEQLYIVRTVIRFSKFERMVTILDAEILKPGVYPALIRILEEYGYKYIPADILETPYDGRFEDIPTWMRRFFYW